MAIIQLDQDHMDQLDSVFDDFSKGMAEYSILERFVEEPTFTAELDRKHLLIVKDIVESALHHNGDYSSSLLSEILSKVDRALGIKESERPVREVDFERAMHGHGIEVEDDDDDDDDEPAGETQRSRGFPPNRPPVKEYPPVAFGNPAERYGGFEEREDATQFVSWLKKKHGLSSSIKKQKDQYGDDEYIVLVSGKKQYDSGVHDSIHRALVMGTYRR